MGLRPHVTPRCGRLWLYPGRLLVIIDEATAWKREGEKRVKGKIVEEKGKRKEEREYFQVPNIDDGSTAAY